MKKHIVLIFFCSFFLFFSQVHAISWNNTSGAVNCNGDPFTNTSGQKRIPSVNNTSAAASGNTPCEFHGYYSGRWYPSAGGWYNTGTDATGNHFSCPDRGYASQIIYNGANTRYRVFCKYRDDTPPVAGDISNSTPADGSNHLATNSQNISFNVGVNGGSPIVQIVGYFEDDAIANSYISTPFTSTNNTLSNNYDIRNVDNNRVNGQRQYSLKITRICDAAGNCTNAGNNASDAAGIKNFTYNVRANQITLGAGRSTISGTNLLTSGNVADGTNRLTQVTLRDTYGNAIVPVPTIRTVDLNVRYNNSLYLNEYTRSGNGAVYIGATRLNIGNNQNTPDTGIFQDDADGVYNLNFNVFSATSPSDAYKESRGRFRILDITATATDLTTRSFITNVDFDFKPLYTANFDSNGDLPRFGFIEGGVQSSPIIIARDTGSTQNGTSKNVLLEFGADEEAILALNATPPNGFVAENQSLSTIFQVNAGFTGTKPLSTLLTQSSPVSNLQDSFLATIVRYNLGGYTITYPSGIINKASYFDSIYNGGAAQTGIKVVGNTSSQNTTSIVVDEYGVDQFDKDIRIIGDFTKSNFKKDIEKNAYEVVRYVTSPNNGTMRVTELGAVNWNNTDGTRISNNNVLYFQNPTRAVEITGDIIGTNSTSDAGSVKTLIVENGDIYISGNIRRANQDDILGIIALEGNIYIDPTVTDIEAILYTNQSIISARDTNGNQIITSGEEFDGSALASDLSNQLYVYGSLFSENTLGASRKSTPECPYYINTTCNKQEAQKYDLNYLRRYFIYDSDANGVVNPTVDIPANGGSRSIGGGIGSGYEEYPVIVDYNPQVQQTPPPFFD